MPKRLGIISNRGKFGVRKGFGQSNEPLNVRPNRLIRQEHIFSVATRCHFRLRDRGALELADAVFHLHANHLGQLMRFDMRPQTLRAAGHLDHAPDIFLNAVGIDQQRRRGDLAHIDYLVPGIKLVFHPGLVCYRIPQTRAQPVHLCQPIIRWRTISPSAKARDHVLRRFWTGFVCRKGTERPQRFLNP